MIEIRQINDEEIVKANKFHNLYYGTSRTILQWTWQFKRALSCGLFVAAVKDDKIIGTQTLMPVTLNVYDQIIIGSKSEETLIDPNARGMGLLKRMYSELFKSDYSKIIFGFTSAAESFKKIGFAVPGKTKQLILLTKFSKIVGSKFNNIFLSWVFIILDYFRSKYIQSRFSVCEYDYELRDSASDIEIDNLALDFIKSEKLVTIYRDSNFLNDRFRTNPYCTTEIRFTYLDSKLVGYIAYAMCDKACNIVDIVSINSRRSDIVKFMLTNIIQIALNSDVGYVRMWNVNENPLDLINMNIAKSFGFYCINKGQSVVIFSSEQSVGEIEYNDWYITRAFTQGTNG